MANFLRGIKEQPRPALTTKTDITNTGIGLIKDLMPHKLEDWQAVTVHETIKHKGGTDPFFQAVADNSSIPIIVVIGKAKTRTIRGKQKTLPCNVTFQNLRSKLSNQDQHQLCPIGNGRTIKRGVSIHPHQ